ncbi:hypothetical protein NUW54_g1081 [Trametes sanguinea]|uniref:Uncharacterized protein n=1 Tax=Trametes sanguinea TaxID=158606 RepID=A0ACC1Q7B3_9APHY|nr:hypothetical protein NUW54_g1081 [Trametes sanguinea]
MEFGPSQIDITFQKENKAFETFQESATHDHTAETERKRWKAVVEREGRSEQWTKGQEYTRLWKEGVRPVYAPIFSEPEITPAGLQQAEDVAAAQLSSQADFLGMVQQRS